MDKLRFLKLCPLKFDVFDLELTVQDNVKVGLFFIVLTIRVSDGVTLENDDFFGLDVLDLDLVNDSFQKLSVLLLSFIQVNFFCVWVVQVLGLHLLEDFVVLLFHKQSESNHSFRLAQGLFEVESIEEQVFAWRHAVRKRHEFILLHFSFVSL